MQLTYSKKAFILLFLVLITRVLTVFMIGKTPCMDITYYAEADRILHNAGRVDIYITPLYGFLLYFLNSIFHSLFISSSLVYIFFSTGAAAMTMLIAKELFDEKTSLVLAILLLFFPNLTVAVAGYSHTVVVSSFFVLWGIYVLIKFCSSKTYSFYSVVSFSLATILGMYFRPECVLILLAISLFIFFKNSRIWKEKIYFLSSSVLIILAGIYLHASFIKYKSNSDYPSVFSDARYTYITYMCTFADIQSLSDQGALGTKHGSDMSDSVSLRLSTTAFGSPESNQWSILKAIKKNPKVAIVHGAFIGKQCLFYFGHPLFSPFYMYLLAGIGLFFLTRQSESKKLLLLSGMFFICLLPLLFAHAEIRYLMNCTFPIILLSAYGITRFESQKKVNVSVAIVSTANFIIYMVYLLNNMKLESLCG